CASRESHVPNELSPKSHPDRAARPSVRQSRPKFPFSIDPSLLDMHAPFALQHFADDPSALPMCPNESQHFISAVWPHNYCHANPHVEYVVQLLIVYISLLLKQAEDREHGP